jgi:Galactose-3-O-sulfotransferase
VDGHRVEKDDMTRSSETCSGDTRRALIFVHMFKSGGNTLNRIMDWEYNPLRIFSVNGRYCRWSYRKLIECRPWMLSQMQVFRGHMPFGLHKFLPQPWTYITLQRDPVERTVSGYFARMNRVYHREHWKAKGMSFEKYLATLALNNSQTKMIAGLGEPDDFLRGECTADTLSVAKDNLRKYFTLVGITERFDETLALAKIRLGWKVAHYSYFNATRGRPGIVTSSIRAMVEEYNAFDVELYRYALGHFNQTISDHADEMPKALDFVRKVRATSGKGLTYYRTASTVLKMFTLGTSTVRSIVRL